MLQDLDHLTRRIAALGDILRDLRRQRDALQSRVMNLEQQCQSLREQHAQEQEKHRQIAQRMERHDQELKQAQAQASSIQQSCESLVHEHQIRSDSLQHSLSQAISERDRLRAAAFGAQQQIELILERLPGAE